MTEPIALADVIAFNEREHERVMPFFGQETLIRSDAKGRLTSQVYRRARATCRLVNGDHLTGSVTTPAAVAGYPHITLPMGFVNGLPVGLSFCGPARDGFAGAEG